MTDVLQPLDVTCFGPLKAEWGKILTRWTSAFGDREPLRKSVFVSRLGEIWHQGLTETNIIAGFRTTGIFPLNPQKRFDPRLLKRYNTWVELGKPDDLHEAMATAPETPLKGRPSSQTENAESSTLDHSKQQESSPSTSRPTSTAAATTPLSLQPASSTPTSSSNVCEVCEFKKVKPPPVAGKVSFVKLSYIFFNVFTHNLMVYIR